KSLSKVEFEKLKKSIVKFGLSFPSFIWKQNGSAKCWDGHQRSRVLTEMQKEGWRVPDVPVVYVDAKNEKEAKEKILLLSSQYWKSTRDSVYEFLTAADIDFGDMKEVIDLPQFDLNQFDKGYFQNIDHANEQMDHLFHVVVECQNEQQQLKLIEKLD